MNINITPKALNRMKQQSQAPFLRVGFKAGGCMGVSNFFEFCHEKRENDIALQYEGLTIIVDPKSAKLLEGATLDWSRNLLKSELIWVFPDKRQKCSCGASVAI